MHECLSCRSYRQVQRFHSKRQPFARLEGFPQYAPDRPFRMRSIALDLEVDPRAKQLQGSVTHTVEKIADEAHIVLDQVGLTIDSVVVEGVAAEYWTDDTSLTIEIPGKHAKKALGDKLTFTVKYRVKEPKRGLYFTGPHPQVWSQGQDEDNRYWFPTFDYPNQKATVELKVTVPKGFWAISNGILAHQATLGQKAQFTYQMRAPIVTYLVTLVVGEFERWEDRGPREATEIGSPV